MPINYAEKQAQCQFELEQVNQKIQSLKSEELNDTSVVDALRYKKRKISARIQYYKNVSNKAEVITKKRTKACEEQIAKNKQLLQAPDLPRQKKYRIMARIDALEERIKLL